jgi:hypothetical protein
MLVNILLLFLCFFTTNCLAGGFNFGNKQSALVIGNGSFLEVKTPPIPLAFGMTKPGEMEIDGGALVNDGFGTITGDNIRFKRGMYSFLNSESDLEGVLEPQGEESLIKLTSNVVYEDGGTMIANPGGLAGFKLSGLPGVNFLRGQPLFFGTNDVELRDSSTLLALAIQNTLNTSITLNGGQLYLQDDLRLGDDAVILDSGRVVFNNRRLSLGGKISTWNGNVIWDGAQDLQLNSAITLNGIWFFLGDGQINGNGNVIDLFNGGIIGIVEGATLRLAGVHIKGLGKSGEIKMAPDAKLILTDVTIEMDDDYVIDAGTVYIEGNSTIITKDHILTFADSVDGPWNGHLTVDRVALTYDTLASIDKYNIQPALINDPDNKYIDILGNGEIRTIRSDTITFHNYRSSPVLLKYAIVAPYRPFYVFPEVNPDGSQNFDVLIDGNTNFLGFTRTDDQVFVVTKGVHATTSNIIMRDLSTKHIGFEEGASLVFGDHTTITLSRNEYLNYKWTFEGETILRGGGSILELGPQGSIEVIGENSTLLLDGVILKGINGENVKCTHDTNKIQMKSVKWIQSDDLSFNHGSLELLDDVTMFGGFKASDATSQYALNYHSAQPFNILANATLLLTRNMKIAFNPTDVTKTNLLTFQNNTAALSMDQATLDSITALTLSGGRLIVRNGNYIGGSVAIGANMLVDQPAGAILQTLG